jgi:S1-C subfamily serine protease
MIRSIAGAIAFLALLRAPAPQELKSEVLDKLKSATVYVMVEDGRARGTGSGFLFLRRGTTGYIMTCEHVVGRASTVKVVFWSGTAQEKSHTARVVATDPSRDIACLIVRDVPGLPPPLELGRKTEIKETETVFAAGFPFGGMLATGRKNPEISISKSSVTSIRRNDSSAVSAVQISGEVNPGNSGGPLVTADGRVIGVTASKIMGTQTAFAVPSEEIQGFLQGRVKASIFRKVEGSPTKAKYEVTLDLVDPLATLKGAGIAYIDEKQVKGEVEPEKDGTWKKIHPSMKNVEFEIDEDRAVKTLEFTQTGSEGLAVVFQCYHIRADGQRVWTEPVTQDISFSAGPDVAGGKRGPKKSPDSPGVTDDPEPPPAPEPPAGPTVELTIPDPVRFSTEMPLSSVFGGLHLSPDGTALYALDLSEGQVYKLDPDTLQVKAKLAVHETAVAMAMTPDGKTLYVGGRAPSIVVMDAREAEGRVAGTLQVISTTTFTTTANLEVKAAIVDLVAADRGLVVATCQAQWNGLVVIDVARKSEDFVHLVYGGGSIRLSRDQRRVYVGDFGLSPADFRCVSLRKEQGKYPTYDSIYHGDHPLGGPFDISPDGKYLIGAYGSILRLGKTKDADLRFVMKIDPFHASALAPGSSTLFTLTADGFLKSYSIGGFELQKSVKLGYRCERAALDPKRRKLYVVVSEIPDPRFPDHRFNDRQPRIGRIASLTLGVK